MDSLGVAQLQAAFAQTPMIGGARYPRGYSPPKKPNVQQMLALGKRRHEQQELYRLQVRRDQLMLRMEMRGIFEDDRADAEAQIMDEYESIALRAEFDLAHSWLTGLERRVLKQCRYPDLEAQSRKIQLAASFLLENEEESYANRGDLEARDAAVREFLLKGRLWIARSFNRYADVGESPYYKRYIDPQEVSWDSGGGQIQRIWRFYMADWQALMQAYGPSISLVWKELKRAAPDVTPDSESTVEVCEYWDTWHRFVTVGGVPVIQAEHKYGEVPYTNIFSPRGEGFFGSIPAGDSDWFDSAEIAREAMAFRTPGYVTYLMREHRQFEAQMNRMQHLAKYALQPDFKRQRSIETYGQAFDEFDRAPGAQYEVPMEDVLEEIAVSPESRAAMEAIVQQQLDERSRVTAPPSAYGGQNDTQATQNAQRGQMLTGQHLWRPWQRSLDAGDGRDLSKALRIYARVGEEAMAAAEGGGRFYVPVSQPRKGEAPVFELTAEDVAQAGAKVKVESNAQDPSDWLLKAQTFKLMREQGFTRRWLSNKLFSFDFDQSAELEGFEELAMDQALQHPQFAEIASVPILMKNWLNEVAGDANLTEFAESMLNAWMQGVTKKAALEVQIKEGELMLQKLQIEQQLFGLTAMQQNPMLALGGGAAPGAPGAPPSSPATPAAGGGQPGTGGRPEEKTAAPTSSDNYKAQSPGGPRPQVQGAEAQVGANG